jgi:hypothetical protein
MTPEGQPERTPMTLFTEKEAAYLRTRHFGRLATTDSAPAYPM